MNSSLQKNKFIQFDTNTFNKHYLIEPRLKKYQPYLEENRTYFKKNERTFENNPMNRQSRNLEPYESQINTPFLELPDMDEKSREKNFSPRLLTLSTSGSGQQHLQKREQDQNESRLYRGIILKINHTYYVDKGNNHKMIHRILECRSWLHEAPIASNANLRWKPTSRDLNFNQLSINPGSKKIIFNHIECHKEISSKQRLYFNLKEYCERQKLKIGSFVPQTFILNIDGPSFQKDLKHFIDEFLLQKVLMNSKNFWIMKPPEMNRGQNIQLLTDLRQFTQSLLEFCKAKTNIQGKTYLRQITISYPSDKFDLNHSSGTSNISFVVEQMIGATERQIVIQKYLENPMLYQGRKFDFRVWVLIDQHMNLYFFKEGYIRLCSEPFVLSNLSARNNYIHLTNNAIQQNHPSYSKVELGNQLSFSDLQKYFNSKGIALNLREKIINRMKELIRTTISSVYDKFIQCSKKYQFELFGYDFMVDTDSQVWLIEINTNPCLEESSPLLQRLIPRMLNDLMRLTVDRILNPLKVMENALPEKFYDFLDQFQIPGYKNTDLLWESMGKIC